MYLLNYVKLSFGFFAGTIVFVGGLLNYFENRLPAFVVQGFRYGKFSYKGKSTFVEITELPKSTFRHFYVYSTILSCAVLGLVFHVFALHKSPPVFVVELLDQITGVFREQNVAPTKAVIAIVLLSVQCFKRLYDTHFVSVFGPKSKINLAHYLLGYLHYTGAYIAILAETPLDHNLYLKWTDIGLLDLIGSITFLWACWHQLEATKILADLRKKNGRVITQGHKLPNGDWFDYVSSPHLLAEILMYTSLTVILWNNSTWIYILSWVLTNQIESALLTHWWYKENFKDFPVRRKAIIPLLL